MINLKETRKHHRVLKRSEVLVTEVLTREKTQDLLETAFDIRDVASTIVSFRPERMIVRFGDHVTLRRVNMEIQSLTMTRLTRRTATLVNPLSDKSLTMTFPSRKSFLLCGELFFPVATCPVTDPLVMLPPFHQPNAGHPRRPLPSPGVPTITSQSDTPKMNKLKFQTVEPPYVVDAPLLPPFRQPNAAQLARGLPSPPTPNITSQFGTLEMDKLKVETVEPPRVADAPDLPPFRQPKAAHLARALPSAPLPKITSKFGTSEINNLQIQTVQTPHVAGSPKHMPSFSEVSSLPQHSSPSARLQPQLLKSMNIPPNRQSHFLPIIASLLALGIVVMLLILYQLYCIKELLGGQ